MPRHRRHCTGTSVRRRSGLRVRAPQAGSEKTEHWSWHTHHRNGGGKREGSWNIRNAATGRKRSVRQLSPAAIRASRGTPRSEGKRADRFKPRCGWTGRQPAGSAQARFRLHGAGQSQPIFRSAKWSRACARETALRCNSAATARCDKAPENTRVGARPRRAISARPPGAHVRVAVPAWKGAIRSLFTIWVGVGSTRKQQPTAHVVRSAGRRNESPHPS